MLTRSRGATLWLLALLPLLGVAFMPPMTGKVSLSSSRKTIARSLPSPPPRNLRLPARTDDEDFVERAFNALGVVVGGLNKDLAVPTFIIPPRPKELGKSTTLLRGWYAFVAGLSLLFGNVAYPTAFIAYLYVSRPADAPDLASAVAAGITSALISPIFQSIGESLELEDSVVGNLPLLLGLSISAFTLYTLASEAQNVFYAPEKEFRERKPALKSERDLRFFDVKLSQKEAKQGNQESTFVAEVQETDE